MEYCLDFEGSQEEYIRHLENIIKQLYHHHQSCPTKLNTQGRGGSASALTSPPNTTSGFHFIEYTPTETITQNRNRGVAKWKRAANELIIKTPKARNWWTELAIIDADTVEQNGRVISFLLDGELSVAHLSPVQFNEGAPKSPPNWLVQCVTSYAQVCRTREKHTTFAIMLVHFQKFLLVCLCVVLLELDQPREEVYRILRVGITDGSDRYLNIIMRAVVWMNEAVDSFDIHGWNNRAAYLLLIWCKSPSYYADFAGSPRDSLEYFNKQLCTPEYTAEVEARTNWQALFVPTLVHNILGKRIHIARISKALGYKQAHVLGPGPDDAVAGINPWDFLNGGTTN